MISCLYTNLQKNMTSSCISALSVHSSLILGWVPIVDTTSCGCSGHLWKLFMITWNIVRCWSNGLDWLKVVPVTLHWQYFLISSLYLCTSPNSFKRRKTVVEKTCTYVSGKWCNCFWKNNETFSIFLEFFLYQHFLLCFHSHGGRFCQHPAITNLVQSWTNHFLEMVPR